MGHIQTKSLLGLFTLGLVSTALYILPSGYPQPGHLLALVVIVPLLFRYKSVVLALPEKMLLIFWGYATSVNLIYWFMHHDMSFIISIVYWTYGLLLFFAMRQLFMQKPVLSIAFPWALLIMLPVLYGLGLFAGDSYYMGSRLVGTFNDPNQMSYWLLCVFVAVLLVGHQPQWLNPYSALVLVGVLMGLVFLSGSRSAMLGFGVVLMGLVWWLIQSRTTNNLVRQGLGSISVKPSSAVCALLFIGALGLAVLVTFAALYHFNEPVNLAVHDFIRRVDQQSFHDQLTYRGYTRLLEFPQYLLFGAGQGYDARFIEPVQGDIYEVHSSLISPLFYYGVVGFGLLYSAFYLMARDRLEHWQWLVFTGIFAYGLFTYGLRTPVFWVMLASLYTIPIKPKVTRLS